MSVFHMLEVCVDSGVDEGGMGVVLTTPTKFVVMKEVLELFGNE